MNLAPLQSSSAVCLFNFAGSRKSWEIGINYRKLRKCVFNMYGRSNLFGNHAYLFS